MSKESGGSGTMMTVKMTHETTDLSIHYGYVFMHSLSMNIRCCIPPSHFGNEIFVELAGNRNGVINQG